jgi:phosphatidylglycerophosphate synthase
MCHPWLAAAVIVFIVVQLVRELAPVFGENGWRADEPSSGFLGTGVRTWFRRRLEPLVDVLLEAGLSANGVTAFQLAGSVVCGAAYAHGWIFTGGWLLIGTGTLDVLDGAMARRRGAAGPRGAFMDSVVDRYGECAVFAGLVAYFASGPALWIVLAAWIGAFMVSYTRARAEGLGVECRGGVMQRPERYVTLGFGSLVSVLVANLTCAATPWHGALIGCIAIVAVLANVTAVQRAASVMRRLA